jgi:hypothetical protein
MSKTKVKLTKRELRLLNDSLDAHCSKVGTIGTTYDDYMKIVHSVQVKLNKAENKILGKKKVHA